MNGYSAKYKSENFGVYKTIEEAYKVQTKKKPISKQENKAIRRLPYPLDEHDFLCFFFLDFALSSKFLHLICKFLSTKPLTNTKIVIDKTTQVGV